MKTCGELYREALKATSEVVVDQISLGFLIGQAEKVFIGACDGCMTKDIELAGAAIRIAEVYGLTSLLLSPAAAQVNSPEVWIYRPPLRFIEYTKDSPEWNLHRAALCGVPAEQINLAYHASSRSTT